MVQPAHISDYPSLGDVGTDIVHNTSISLGVNTEGFT